jgi:hypothetical protein
MWGLTLYGFPNVIYFALLHTPRFGTLAPVFQSYCASPLFWTAKLGSPIAALEVSLSFSKLHGIYKYDL